MAVRDAMLVILSLGPAYGFQVHGELARRTGGRRAVNVGQSYATIERLARQGLVEAAGTTDDGLPLHRLTDAGRRAAERWLGGVDAVGADPWDETVDRVLLARSLPGRDAARVIAAERARWTERLDAGGARAPGPPAGGASPELQLATAGAVAVAERARAALRWLETMAAAEDDAPGGAELAPRSDRPRRGRPAAARAAGGSQPA
ncbi:PadR family transcriptional regulator [Agromyces archimandritae]|uniref:PadR family transcriptional regulator n=1 Tax=Agromyces archimandritae TaxID=2781962 RepID=A0A975FLT0_9MICO|nr:PadR family transcriptional regulator [Agromyces archimandritae]QTX04833.1 PadR family transcriptional regulator [Agromyces archimandritae]